jgi:hypothetical protein
MSGSELGGVARCGRRAVLLLATMLLLPLAVRGAEDEADIVVGCHLSIGEFGYEAIDLCVRENRAARAEVRQLPSELQGIVARCTSRWEPQWVMVKRCIEGDRAAAAALAAYPSEQGQTIERCRDQFGESGDARVKKCVDQALEAQKSSGASERGSR